MRISQTVPTPNAQTIPYAYTSGSLLNELMSAMPDAMVFVDTRPRSSAPANSNIEAIWMKLRLSVSKAHSFRLETQSESQHTSTDINRPCFGMGTSRVRLHITKNQILVWIKLIDCTVDTVTYNDRLSKSESFTSDRSTEGIGYIVGTCTITFTGQLVDENHSKFPNN